MRHGAEVADNHVSSVPPGLAVSRAVALRRRGQQLAAVTYMVLTNR